MRLTTVFIFLITFALPGFAGEIPADKEVVEFDTKMGTVTFNHKTHAGMEGVECTTCHHTAKEGGEIQACSTCHLEEAGDAPKAKDALHENCKGCHEEMEKAGKTSGPTKCTKCHVKG